MKFLQSFLYSQLDLDPVAIEARGQLDSDPVAIEARGQLNLNPVGHSDFRFETALRNLDHFGYVIRFVRINFREFDSRVKF
jgi:hypothetical protein